MVTRWFWLRHGPTHEKAFLGWRDVDADLSDTAAIERLDAFLPAGAFVVSSDLRRARQTADAVARSRPRLRDDPALREFNFGHWDGVSFDEIAARNPQLSKAFWDRPGDIAPPAGESWNMVAARVSGAVSRLSKQYAGADVIAVAHIGVIMTQIGLCAGQSPTSAISNRIDNLSVTRIDVGPDGASLGFANHRP